MRIAVTAKDALKSALNKSVAWNAARLNFLALFLLALVDVKTVNLSEIANAFDSEAETASSYKRIQRFLRDFDLDYAAWGQIVADWMGVPSPWVLSLDRTNWQLGQKNLNILVLALVWGGVRLPLFWTMLDKKGNSNTDERIALLQQFCQVFGAENSKFLCGDREFVGQRWFNWLRANGIDFCMKIKENTLAATRRGVVKVKRLFQSQAAGVAHEVRGPRVIWRQAAYLRGMRLADGESVIIATPQESPQALEDYRARWGIECLFSCLKTRGFRLEETHVTHGERLSKLLALLALAVVWALNIRHWLRAAKPLRIKKHGRAAQSLFRRGLDWLRKLTLNLHNSKRREQFDDALEFLSGT
jgi:hypothetical protein